MHKNRMHRSIRPAGEIVVEVIQIKMRRAVRPTITNHSRQIVETIAYLDYPSWVRESLRHDRDNFLSPSFFAPMYQREQYLAWIVV